eukprot:scaffold447_cov307-Pinguiococcus_pyrenoidosus.AAC.59
MPRPRAAWGCLFGAASHAVYSLLFFCSLQAGQHAESKEVPFAPRKHGSRPTRVREEAVGSADLPKKRKERRAARKCKKEGGTQGLGMIRRCPIMIGRGRTEKRTNDDELRAKEDEGKTLRTPVVKHLRMLALVAGRELRDHLTKLLLPLLLALPTLLGRLAIPFQFASSGVAVAVVVLEAPIWAIVASLALHVSNPLLLLSRGLARPPAVALVEYVTGTRCSPPRASAGIERAPGAAKPEPAPQDAFRAAAETRAALTRTSLACPGVRSACTRSADVAGRPSASARHRRANAAGVWKPLREAVSTRGGTNVRWTRPAEALRARE